MLRIRIPRINATITYSNPKPLMSLYPASSWARILITKINDMPISNLPTFLPPRTTEVNPVVTTIKYSQTMAATLMELNRCFKSPVPDQVNLGRENPTNKIVAPIRRNPTIKASQSSFNFFISVNVSKELFHACHDFTSKKRCSLFTLDSTDHLSFTLHTTSIYSSTSLLPVAINQHAQATAILHQHPRD